jgi:ABC-type lipoprotein release transport system permease subunit
MRHLDDLVQDLRFTLLAVAAGLAAVTMIACYIPARRVLSIDPAQSLRQA